jgi:hypothetical protein
MRRAEKEDDRQHWCRQKLKPASQKKRNQRNGDRE